MLLIIKYNKKSQQWSHYLAKEHCVDADSARKHHQGKTDGHREHEAKLDSFTEYGRSEVH